MSGYRLSQGGLIDRSVTIPFRFNNCAYSGFSGDTLASAMLANGIRLVGRSFKRHRPRGIMTAGPEEPNALLGVGLGDRFEPNTRATQVQLYRGLVAESQNHWPSLSFDALRLIDAVSPLFPAGFYYKTFKWPSRAWPLYEGAIRRLAGLGKPPKEQDKDHYEERFLFPDVFVVGLGTTGLAAALSAAQAGLRVVAAEADWVTGGYSLSSRGTFDGLSGPAFAEKSITRLRSLGVRILTRTSVFGAYDHSLFGAFERQLEPGEGPSDSSPVQRVWRIRAQRTILATGAIERPIVFSGNDCPGVMLAHAGQTYLNRFGVCPGQRPILFTNNDSAYRTFADFSHVGQKTLAIIDTRPAHSIAPWALALAEACETPVMTNSMVLSVHGRMSISAVTVLKDTGSTSKLNCDSLLVSGGFTPTIHLHAQARGKLKYDDKRAIVLPQDPSQTVLVAGSAAGIETQADCWSDGWNAGAACAEALGRTRVPLERIEIEDGHQGWGVVPCVPSIAGKLAKTAFVDHQNDVTLADLKLGVQEGYESIEHLKRYTTLGMGTDQGKTSNLIGLGILADLRGVDPASVGTTTYRPPYVPVTLSTLAAGRTGPDAAVTRRTPFFEIQTRQGAIFQSSGLWLRARYYPRSGEKMHDATLREATSVRQAVGLYDGSSLGKVEIRGPDAAAFLDAIYAVPTKKLQIGRARYGVMLREDGFVFDDGTLWRLEEHRYFATLSTARSYEVIRHLEFYRDVVFSSLDVTLTDVTEQWAVLVIAGPRSEELLRRHFPDAPALAPQGVGRWSRGDQEYLLARISYSGEKAFELYVPARCADTFWIDLEVSARDLGGGAYGLEALEWLRIEKGHIAVGAEIDGRTLASDLGLGRWLKPSGYVGASCLKRPAFVASDRLSLVGLTSSDGQSIPEGSALLPTDYREGPRTPIGHVTSAGFSVGLDKPIALALLRDGQNRMGETLLAASPVRGERVYVSVGPPCAFDLEGRRLVVA